MEYISDSADSKFEADSFKRFEMLLKKTENFSRCLSAGDVSTFKGMTLKKISILVLFFSRSWKSPHKKEKRTTITTTN